MCFVSASAESRARRALPRRYAARISTEGQSRWDPLHAAAWRITASGQLEVARAAMSPCFVPRGNELPLLPELSSRFVPLGILALILPHSESASASQPSALWLGPPRCEPVSVSVRASCPLFGWAGGHSVSGRGSKPAPLHLILRRRRPLDPLVVALLLVR